MEVLTIALGCTSVIISFISLFGNGIVSILGIAVGTIGFICGYIGKKGLEIKEQNKIYQVGIILSVIGLSLSFIVFAIFFANMSKKTIEGVTGLYNSIVT